MIEKIRKLSEETTSSEELEIYTKQLKSALNVLSDKENKINIYNNSINQNISTLKKEKNQLNILLYKLLWFITSDNIQHIYKKYINFNLPHSYCLIFNKDYNNISKHDINNIPIDVYDVFNNELNSLYNMLIEYLYNYYEKEKYNIDYYYIF